MSLIRKELQSGGAVLLIKAVRDLIPEAKILQFQISSLGFSCDFVFKKKVDLGLIHQLKERCRSLLTAKLRIKKHEMTPSNAALLFSHHGEALQAQMAKEAESSLVSVVQLDDLFVLCPESLSSELSDIHTIFLYEEFEELLQRKQKVVRLRGAAFTDVNQQKQFQKRFEKYLRHNHLVEGEKQHFWNFRKPIHPSSVVWLTKGVSEIQSHWEKVKHLLKPLSYEEILTSEFVQIGEKPSVLRPSMAYAHIVLGIEKMRSGQTLPIRFLEFGKIYPNPPFEELYGTINSVEHFMDAETILCTQRDAVNVVISSLQSILEIIKMFDIPFHWVLCTQSTKGKKPGKRKDLDRKLWTQATSILKESLERLNCAFTIEEREDAWGPCIETRIKDLLEREWTGSFIEINLTLLRMILQKLGKVDWNEETVIVHQSMLGPVDRFISLKIEQKVSLNKTTGFR